MTELTIELKKAKDGSSALSCKRADGSVTWQHHRGEQGRFFPLHDLTHYAVETVLDCRRGFYGLVAEGWDVDDFGMPWRRGPLPREALTVELIVGFFDSERASGTRLPAEDFNVQVATFYAQHGIEGTFELSDDELGRIRATRSDLFAQWNAVAPGEKLVLEFSSGGAVG
jgi:hypothetical protein